MPRLNGHELEIELELDARCETDLRHFDETTPTHAWQRHADRRTRRRAQHGTGGWSEADDADLGQVDRIRPPRRRDDGQETFRCRHCQALIGPTVSGGRHRNHCPLCLYSRHVDDRRPGDRASTCRSLMAPVGTFFRLKGEQVVVHRCLGCGLERFNRVAADDNDLALMRLPLVPPRSAKSGGVSTSADETAGAIDEREVG